MPTPTQSILPALRMPVTLASMSRASSQYAAQQCAGLAYPSHDTLARQTIATNLPCTSAADCSPAPCPSVNTLYPVHMRSTPSHGPARAHDAVLPAVHSQPHCEGLMYSTCQLVATLRMMLYSIHVTKQVPAVYTAHGSVATHSHTLHLPLAFDGPSTTGSAHAQSCSRAAPAYKSSVNYCAQLCTTHSTNLYSKHENVNTLCSAQNVEQQASPAAVQYLHHCHPRMLLIGT